jgi:antitoxin Phd
MIINTENLVSITETNQNFSRVACLVDRTGAAVVLKNNTPDMSFLTLTNSRRTRPLLPVKLWPPLGSS